MQFKYKDGGTWTLSMSSLNRVCLPFHHVPISQPGFEPGTPPLSRICSNRWATSLLCRGRNWTRYLLVMSQLNLPSFFPTFRRVRGFVVLGVIFSLLRMLLSFLISICWYIGIIKQRQRSVSIKQQLRNHCGDVV